MLDLLDGSLPLPPDVPYKPVQWDTLAVTWYLQGLSQREAMLPSPAVKLTFADTKEL